MAQEIKKGATFNICPFWVTKSLKFVIQGHFLTILGGFFDEFLSFNNLDRNRCLNISLKI